MDPKEVDIVNSYLINRTVGLFSNREISYGELRNSLIKLFGEDGLSETESQAIFANRAQRTNENIHRYFAALNGLCQKAFLSLSLQDRERMVTTRFINGLTNDNLRRKLLSDYDPNDPKNTLCLADRYNKICNSKQIGETIHAIRTTLPTMYEKCKALAVASFKGDRLCHHCGLPNHIQRDCPLKYEPTILRLSNSLKCNVDSLLNNISGMREIKGICSIDDVSCEYLTDTGASKTVIHERLLNRSRTKDILPFDSIVLTADGSCANILGSLKVKLEMHEHTMFTYVLVAKDLCVDCLMGMDVLTIHPSTKEAIHRLSMAIQNRIKPLPQSKIKDQTSPPSCISRTEPLTYHSYIAMIKSVGSNSGSSRASTICSEPLNVNPKQDFQDAFDVIDSPLTTGITRDDNPSTSTINSSIDKNFIDSLHAYFDGITATNMADLTHLTNKNLPTYKFVSHEINIEPGSVPIKQKTRGIPYNYRADFKKMILEMKSAGLIVDSKSPWCSPVRLVRKKDKSIRVCVDYRKLNNVTIKDAYPIPRIEDLFSYLKPAKVFTTLDLASGYYQVKMDADCRKYTAFSCDFGFFEYNVMPMGLTNACATFQRLMDNVLRDFIGKICLVYLDDIIIFSENMVEHLEHVRLIAECLREHNLKVKLSKCRFAQDHVEYLSHIIGNGTIKPNPAKIEAVANFKRPTNVKTTQGFLGLVSYYRKFIKNCAKICSPLINLTKKGVIFEWTDECQDAFEFLRDSLTQEDNILILPDYDAPFRIETDASKYGVGGVLSQIRDNKWHPVSYFSKHLSKTESNYSASEREMLAIVLSIERFKQYVYGRQVVILSDHQPLKYLLTADVPEPRLARLLNRLRVFEYKIDYRAGKEHGNADALSRMVDESHYGEVNFDEDSNVVLNAIHLKSDFMNKQQLTDPNIKWIYDLKKESRHLGVRPLINEFPSAEAKSLYIQWHRIYILGKNVFREYVDTNDCVTYQYIVPMKQRPYVLEKSHDTVTSGHLGVEKTMHRIMPKFYWYKQIREIKDYVQSCERCQQNKSPHKYNVAPLEPLRPSRPNELITTDIMGKLPKSVSGSHYLLVVIDHFTKWVELFPMVRITAADVASKLMLVFYRHGIPDTILSDQGSNYQSQLLAEIYELLDVHKVRTSPYHPQCDGITERFNRTIQSMLTSFVNDNQKNWCTLLPSLAFAYNTAVHSSTKATPFELMYGRKPKVPVDLIFSHLKLELHLDPNGYASELKNNLHTAFDQVIKNRDLAMDRNKVRHDRCVRAANFELHDLVWVLDTAKIVGVTSKLARKWKGPYKILAKINQSTFEIQPIKKKGKKLVINQSRLMKCFTRAYENVVNLREDPKKPKKRTVIRPIDDMEIHPIAPSLVWPDTAISWPNNHASEDAVSVSLSIREPRSQSADLSDPLINPQNLDTVTSTPEVRLQSDNAQSTNIREAQNSVIGLAQNEASDESQILPSPVRETVDPTFMVNKYFEQQVKNNRPVACRPKRRPKVIERLGI